VILPAIFIHHTAAAAAALLVAVSSRQMDGDPVSFEMAVASSRAGRQASIWFSHCQAASDAAIDRVTDVHCTRSIGEQIDHTDTRLFDGFQPHNGDLNHMS